ncbi:urease accessory protein UreD [Paroceanicella profunda]|uniref:Urease accessory protein UreD n=1 Tax=Paroceanicella profunda TaxID=2579971 RepID=A0A5B8FQF6_9RHOB|nr:urease accessory protein UreD [Paroceanicella profunda]QDL90866.1 urease accessory protein UreD [Paroceanicella profunda]
MTVALPPSGPLPARATQPRAQGESRIAVRLGPDGRTLLSKLYQQGSAKILLPTARDPALEAVLLNTSGGITGGDRISCEGRAEAGARLVLTTQAAERLYKSWPDETPGRLSTRLSIGPGARIDWLPQETIAFDRSALHRSLDVEMAADATFLALEPIILGRTAMGERVHSIRLRDHWRVRRDGRLIYADALRLEGPALEALAGPATLGGGFAFASMLFVAPGAEDLLTPLRARLEGIGAASARDGFVSMRLVAPDGLALRRCILDTLGLLLGRALPRVWHM